MDIGKVGLLPPLTPTVQLLPSLHIEMLVVPTMCGKMCDTRRSPTSEKIGESCDIVSNGRASLSTDSAYSYVCMYGMIILHRTYHTKDITYRNLFVSYISVLAS
jgi:hypothetical protein